MANYHEWSHLEVVEESGVGVGTGDSGGEPRICVSLEGVEINAQLASSTKALNWVSLTPACAKELYEQLTLVSHFWKEEQKMPDPEAEQGLNLNKFTVKRTNGSSEPGGKHEHCTFFVLDIQHDPFAEAALEAYAKACEAKYPHLARDIRDGLVP